MSNFNFSQYAAEISVLSSEIENLKSQLGVNADDESTAAAAATVTTAAQQNVEDHRPSTNEHSDFQSVQTRAEAELKRLRLLQTFAGLHWSIFFFFCQENESLSVKVSFSKKSK